MKGKIIVGISILLASLGNATLTQDALRIGIIIGSTRNERVSSRLAHAVLQLISTNSKIRATIIDIQEYDLPFFNDALPPMQRTTITDPRIQEWSNCIRSYDAFIIIAPEYNGGYPAALKNALDSLYHEWNNKPVAFIGHSGGTSGGIHVIQQLRTVTKSLMMVPIPTSITVPSSWMALDSEGKFTNKTITSTLVIIISELLTTI